jgi:hypothetical protein
VGKRSDSGKVDLIRNDSDLDLNLGLSGGGYAASCWAVHSAVTCEMMDLAQTKRTGVGSCVGKKSRKKLGKNGLGCVRRETFMAFQSADR